MTTLTWLPKSDSRRTHNYGQTDGSGSGVDVPGMEMAVESRSRGGSPSDDDEEYNSYYDNYYEDGGSGIYGSGGGLPDATPVEKGGKNGAFMWLMWQLSVVIVHLNNVHTLRNSGKPFFFWALLQKLM